jgi:hypothetical protein
MARARRDWHWELTMHGQEVGFQVVCWDGEPLKSNLVLIRCKHTEQWVYPHGQLRKRHCCRSGAYRGVSKPGSGNPYAGGGPSKETKQLPGVTAVMVYRDSDGVHIKVGYTGGSLSRRYGSSLVRPLVSFRASRRECYDLEQAVLKEARKRGWRYSSSSTTELIKPEGFQEVAKWIQAGTLL